jgi:molybdenum cofactor cytidylyltransferase
MGETLVEAGLEEVIAVVAPEPAELFQVLGDLPIRFVENPRFFEGMATSLAAGVAALSPEITSAVVALGDMPLVKPGVIRALMEALHGSQKTIAIPTHKGRRGHPVAFDLGRHREALLTLSGDQGARALLSAYPAEVVELPVDDPAVLLDVDTAEDLRALQGMEGDGDFGSTTPHDV